MDTRETATRIAALNAQHRRQKFVGLCGIITALSGHGLVTVGLVLGVVAPLISLGAVVFFVGTGVMGLADRVR